MTSSATVTETRFCLDDQTERKLPLSEWLATTPFTPDSNTVIWRHFTYIREEETLKAILAPYGIHELVIEDILSPTQRTKAEAYMGYIFLVGRSFVYKSSGLRYDQLFMLILPGLVMTFEPHAHASFNGMDKTFNYLEREHADVNAGYLAYVLLDTLIQHHFRAVRTLLERIEKIDRKLFTPDNKLTLKKAHRLKQDTIRMRSTVQRMQEALDVLLRSQSTLFTEHSKTYLRDLVDHCNQMLDLLNNSVEMVQAITDSFLNLQSNQMNRQMRLLTAITIIFMPLTLLTGIYGMNFNHMPELNSRYGYFILLAVMAGIASALVRIFRKKQWL